MNIKCKVCGTVNNNNDAFCKGCFLPLHKTLEEWTQTLEDKVNAELNSQPEIKVEPVQTNEQPIINDFRTVQTEQHDDLRAVQIEESVNDDLRAVQMEEPINVGGDLRTVTFTEDSKKQIKKEQKSYIPYVLRFDVLFIIMTLAFTYFYGIKLDSSVDIMLGVVTTIVFGVVTSLLTFRKVPVNVNQIKMCKMTLFSIIIFELAIRFFMLYKASFMYIHVFIFIGIVYLLIAILILNFISKLLNNDEVKIYIPRLNITVLLMIVMLTAFGVLAKMNNIRIDYDEYTGEVVSMEEIPDEVKDYITSIDNKIITNLQNDTNYEIPKKITDKNFVKGDSKITAVDLTIDEFGTVQSGTIIYDNVTYIYKDRSFMKRS